MQLSEGHLWSFPHRNHAFEEHFEGLDLPIGGACLQVLLFKTRGKAEFRWCCANRKYELIKVLRKTDRSAFKTTSFILQNMFLPAWYMI